MRILLTTPSMQIGGMERVITMLVPELVARGHVVALAAAHGAFDEDLRDVRHLRIQATDHGRSPSALARSALHLTRGIRQFSPDLIHAQNVRSAVTACVAALATRPSRRPPVVATVQGVDPSQYRSSARVLRMTDHVACVSSDLVDGIVAAGHPAHRTSLIHNAITPATPLGPAYRAKLDREFETGGAPVVAIVGRLVAQKAHERFVVAARHVASELPAVRFLIVGEGPRRKEIEGAVAAAKLKRRVCFTGVRADAREILARADIVAFSSEWEGLSLAALEALAAGTPVVATDVQGMRELLASGAGAVVPLDDGTALGERIVSVLRDEQARRAMGEAGRALIERRFSVDGMVDRYELLYRRLTNSQGQTDDTGGLAAQRPEKHP